MGGQGQRVWAGSEGRRNQRVGGCGQRVVRETRGGWVWSGKPGVDGVVRSKKSNQGWMGVVRVTRGGWAWSE